MIPLHDDNPTTLRPLVTVGLMIGCIWVFAWQVTLGDALENRAVHAFGLIPAVLTGNGRLPPELDLLLPPLTMLSSVFLHGGFLHLAGNLLYLWVFGNNVEDAMGHARFALFFFSCAILAALWQTAAMPHSTVPMIGASGAISGVLGAYLLLHPAAHVLVALPLGFIVITLRVPAGVMLIAWFALQLAGSLAADPGAPGIAWLAHLGGFVSGLVPDPVPENVAMFACFD